MVNSSLHRVQLLVQFAKILSYNCGPVAENNQSFKVRSTAHEGLWPYERMAFYESVANDNLIAENAVTTNREEPSPADQSPVEPTTADLTDFVRPASQHGVSTPQRTAKPPVQNPQTSFIESLDRNVRPRRCKPPVASIRKKMVNQHGTKKVPSLPHNYIDHLFLFLCLLVRKVALLVACLNGHLAGWLLSRLVFFFIFSFYLFFVSHLRLSPLV